MFTRWSKTVLTRPVTRRRGRHPQQNFSPPLEKCVEHSWKLFDLLQKTWAPLKLFATPGVRSWLQAWCWLWDGTLKTQKSLCKVTECDFREVRFGDEEAKSWRVITDFFEWTACFKQSLQLSRCYCWAGGNQILTSGGQFFHEISFDDIIVLI